MEMYFILNIFHLVAFAVDCAVYGSVIQLFTCGLVTRLLNWYQQTVNV